MQQFDFSAADMMIVAAARALAGVTTMFVGVGLPNLVCNLARRTVAPDLQMIYESGVYGAQPARQPLSIGDPTLVSGALAVVSMADLFGLYLQRGLVEAALVGAAQVDRYGNLNSTVIGDYAAPTVRLPGSGGACEIATHARRVFIVMRLSRRSFVSQLDFVTSPGHRYGDLTRSALGLPGGGPEQVLTDRAIFDFANEDREMQVGSLHPGVTLEAVQAAIGWPIRCAPDMRQTALPTAEELRLIRSELDPHGLYR